METSRHLHVYSIQLQKITLKFQIDKIAPFHFCQPLIHLELLIFIQFEFLQFETNYNKWNEMFQFLKLITIITNESFVIGTNYNDYQKNMFHDPSFNSFDASTPFFSTCYVLVFCLICHLQWHLDIIYWLLERSTLSYLSVLSPSISSRKGYHNPSFLWLGSPSQCKRHMSWLVVQYSLFWTYSKSQNL